MWTLHEPCSIVPNLLFLDEGLQRGWTFRLRRYLEPTQANSEEQMTIVLTAHYLNEADDADKIYIADHGQVAQGSADQIKGNYMSPISYGFWVQDVAGLEKFAKRLCLGASQEGVILHPKTTQEALTLLAQAGPYVEQFEFLEPWTMLLWHWQEGRYANILALQLNAIFYFISRNRSGVILSLFGAIIPFVLYIVFGK